MKAILVTGGAGYIGSHTCKALAQAGYLPVTLDNLESGHPELVRWGPLIRADVRDRETVLRTLRVHQVEAVIHFAGRIAVGESVREPLLHYEHNVAGTLTLLEAMLEADVRRIVFSSSAAVYGIPEMCPLVEDAAIAPISPYGRSKAMVESILADALTAHGLQYVCLRYFNAAGADPDGETGEWHEPETHLIPLAMEAVTGGRPLIVFGRDYPTPDGTCIRDYIHVCDLASAHVLALDALASDQAIPRVLNVGTGQGFSVQQIVQTIEQISGKRVPRIHGERRPGDPAVLVADPSVIMKELDWRPLHSSLDSIIGTAWAWHRQRLERSR